MNVKTLAELASSLMQSQSGDADAAIFKKIPKKLPEPAIEEAAKAVINAFKEKQAALSTLGAAQYEEKIAARAAAYEKAKEKTGLNQLGGMRDEAAVRRNQLTADFEESSKPLWEDYYKWERAQENKNRVFGQGAPKPGERIYVKNFDVEGTLKEARQLSVKEALTEVALIDADLEYYGKTAPITRNERRDWLRYKGELNDARDAILEDQAVRLAYTDNLRVADIGKKFGNDPKAKEAQAFFQSGLEGLDKKLTKNKFAVVETDYGQRFVPEFQAEHWSGKVMSPDDVKKAKDEAWAKIEQHGNEHPGSPRYGGEMRNSENTPIGRLKNIASDLSGEYWDLESKMSRIVDKDRAYAKAEKALDETRTKQYNYDPEKDPEVARYNEAMKTLRDTEKAKEKPFTYRQDKNTTLEQVFREADSGRLAATILDKAQLPGAKKGMLTANRSSERQFIVPGSGGQPLSETYNYSAQRYGREQQPTVALYPRGQLSRVEGVGPEGRTGVRVVNPDGSRGTRGYANKPGELVANRDVRPDYILTDDDFTEFMKRYDPEWIAKKEASAKANELSGRMREAGFNPSERQKFLPSTGNADEAIPDANGLIHLHDDADSAAKYLIDPDTGEMKDGANIAPVVVKRDWNNFRVRNTDLSSPAAMALKAAEQNIFGKKAAQSIVDLEKAGKLDEARAQLFSNLDRKGVKRIEYSVPNEAKLNDPDSYHADEVRAINGKIKEKKRQLFDAYQNNVPVDDTSVLAVKDDIARLEGDKENSMHRLGDTVIATWKPQNVRSTNAAFKNPRSKKLLAGGAGAVGAAAMFGGAPDAEAALESPIGQGAGQVVSGAMQELDRYTNRPIRALVKGLLDKKGMLGAVNAASDAQVFNKDVTGEDVANSYLQHIPQLGFPNPATGKREYPLAGPMGFAVDLALDPTNLLGMGAAEGAIRHAPETLDLFKQSIMKRGIPLP